MDDSTRRSAARGTVARRIAARWIAAAAVALAGGAAHAGDDAGAPAAPAPAPAPTPSADDARALFGVASPPAAAPAPACGDGAAFGCVLPTDPLAPVAPGAVRTTLDARVLGAAPGTALPDAGATFDQLVGLATGVGPGGVVPGATAVEDRWLVDGAPADDVRDGTAGTRVPALFLDAVDVTTGGFTARDRASTGALIDARLRGGETRTAVALAWLGLAAPARHADSAVYAPLTGHLDRPGRVTLAVLAGGPAGRLAGARLWYLAGVQPTLRPVRFTRTARSLVDADANGVPDQDAAGLTTLTVDEATTDVAGIGDVPFVLRAGARRGPHELALTLVGTYAADARFAPVATAAAGTVDLPSFHGDAIATWRGRWGDTLASVQWAWHADRTWQRARDPAAATAPQINSAFVPAPALIPADFALGVACDDAAAGDPYPNIVNCPLAVGYFARDGAGPLVDTAADRPSVTASVAHLVGGHRLEAGVTGEDARLVVTDHITGGYYRRTLFGVDEIDTRYVALGDGPDFPDACSLDGAVHCRWLDVASTTYRTRQLAGWLEDTWRPGPGVAADYGVRWEAMELGGAPTLHQLLPRFSLAWDPLGGGRSRLYAGFARTAPLLPGRLAETLGGAPTQLTTVVLPIGQSDFIDTFRGLRVADGIEPMIVDDVTAGAEVALGGALRLGVAGQWRLLRRGLDSDGALLVNPGQAGGPTAERRAGTLTIDVATAPTAPVVVRAGYTYATATGDWDGPADPVLGATYYDGPDFAGAPTTGALASDLHHRFFAELDTRHRLRGGPLRGATLVVGGRATVASGRPVGAFDGTGSVILARGGLPRTPPTAALDLRLGLVTGAGELGVEAFDLFDRRTVTTVDERYTGDAARPIAGGDPADLLFLRADDGSIPHRNRNYGRPTSYQAPLSAFVYYRATL